MMNVRFNAQDHTYWSQKGKRIPSVTEILKGVGLIDCSHHSPEHAVRGRFVHALCQHHDEGWPIPDTDEYQGYLEAWKRFLEESGCVVIHCELLVHKGYLYAGTLDRVLLLPDGRRCVCDIKTGQIQPWVCFQTAAYAACLPGEHARMAVQVKRDGKYSTRVFEYARDSVIFHYAAEVYRWRMENV